MTTEAPPASLPRMSRFRALRAWQEARRFAILSNDAIEHLPAHERFILAEQWRRAAYSVGLNLAEGAGRRTIRDFRRFVAIARGSLDELEAILDLVDGLAYLPQDRVEDLQRSRKRCAQLVAGLMRRLDGLADS